MNPTIVVAVIGFVGTIVGTLGGVLITQWRSDVRESTAWARESKRESDRWEREDAARTFEQRRDAYTGFFEANEAAVRLINRSFDDPPRWPFPSGWQYPMHQQLQRVEIYGSEATVARARRAFDVVTAWAGTFRSSPDEPGRILHDEDMSYEADGSPRMFITAVREELRIPKGEAVLPDHLQQYRF